MIATEELATTVGGVTKIVFQHKNQGVNPQSREEKHEVIPINELRWRLEQLLPPPQPVACARVLGPIFNGCLKTTGHTRTAVAIANSIINRVAQ